MSKLAINKNFPAQVLPMSKKGKAWRKQHLDWADRNSHLNNAQVRKRFRDKKVNFGLYDGVLDIADMKLVLNPGGLEKYFIPDAVQHYPIITPRINVLVGEEKRRKFDWSVQLMNPNTISMVIKDKKRMLDQKLQELLMSKLPEEEVAKELESYSQYINFDYLDVREKRANVIMRNYIEKLDMKFKFQQGFKEALIAGEEAYMFDVVNGEVTFEKLNTNKVFTLRSGSSNRMEDADVIVLDDYWSPGKIQDHYYEDMKKLDVKKLEEYSGTIGNINSDGVSEAIDDVAGFEILERESINAFLDASGVYDGHGARSSYYDSDGNIRVLRMLWKSKKKILKISFPDGNGGLATKFRSEDYIINKDKGEVAKEFWVNQWWKGVKIGEDIYLQIKPREIQYNKIGQPSFNSSGVVGQIYNTNDRRAVSMLDRAKPFQYLYDISWYRVNEALAKYLGSIMEVDVAKIPKGWNLTKWLYFARKAGIGVVDSFKEGQRGMAKGKLAGAVGNTTGKVLDQKVGDFIQTHIEMMEFAKAQMDEITGVSRQRLGQVENRETVGGVERAVSQSNHITEELFTMHDYCKKRCFQILLETAKHAMKGKSVKFQYIADDYTRQVMEVDGDEFAEEEYGLQVSNDDAINQMEQKLDGMVQLGLQNQMISFSTAMKIYNSPSLREVQRMIEKDESDMHQRQSQQAEAEMKAQQAAAQQQAATEEAERQIDVDKTNKEDDTKRYIAELKDATDRLKIGNEEQGIESPETNEDDKDFEKFSKELNIKQQGLDNDMSKHKDNLGIKEKELIIKKKAANKPAPVAKK